MKFYSEETKNFYDSAEECTEAEEALKAEKEQEAKLAKELEENRETRAKEVETLRKEWKVAEKAYRDALSDFLKDYGTFHSSTHLTKAEAMDVINDLFASWPFWF